MTFQELSRNIALHKRLQTLETTLAALEAAPPLGGQEITSMPHGTAVGDPVFALVRELESLREGIERLKTEIAELEAEIRAFLLTVDDVIVRVVLHLHFLQCLTWRETAAAAGYGTNNGERARMIVYRFFSTQS
jgi:hypothetical protein